MSSHLNPVIWPALVAGLFSGVVNPALACSCKGAGLTPCREIAVGSAVFTGKVISISPAFLNRFDRSSRSDYGRVAQFYDQLEPGASTQDLQKLKDTFRALVSGLPGDVADRLNLADSPLQLRQLFDSALNRGSNITFDVKTVFAAGGHDDDGDKDAKDKDKDDDDDDSGLVAGKPFSVWTPFGDCGVEFQTSETYLVYASSDEDTDEVETDICMGTRRLSDAGADLPFLYFYKSNPKESGHLDGFVTSDPLVRATLPESNTIASPVTGLLIELKSDDTARYTTSGADGRFVFDGLEEDSYQLSGYKAEYPDPRKVAAGPDELKINVKACGRYVLLARPD